MLFDGCIFRLLVNNISSNVAGESVSFFSLLFRSHRGTLCTLKMISEMRAIFRMATAFDWGVDFVSLCPLIQWHGNQLMLASTILFRVFLFIRFDLVFSMGFCQLWIICLCNFFGTFDASTHRPNWTDKINKWCKRNCEGLFKWIPAWVHFTTEWWFQLHWIPFLLFSHVQNRGRRGMIYRWVWTQNSRQSIFVLCFLFFWFLKRQFQVIKITFHMQIQLSLLNWT